MSSPPVTQNATRPSPEGLQITDLPDDCLTTIFNHLCFLDIYSAFRSCQRFRSSAVYSSRSDCKTLRIASTPRDEGRFFVEIDQTAAFDWIEQSYSDLRKLFENFGNCIRSLELFAGNASGMIQILRLANQYCGENLKTLSLELIVIGENRIADFSNVFKHLEKLRLENTTISDTVIFMRTYKTILQNAALQKCLSYCENLKELTVLGTVFDAEDPQKLFAMHPRLKSIKVPGMFTLTSRYLDHLDSTETLLIDLKSMPLTELQQIDWTRLFQLQNLKHLELVLNKTTPLADSSSLKFLTNPTTNIQILVLKAYHFSDIYDLLTSFTYTNLKVLVIYFDLVCVKNGHNAKPRVTNQLIMNLRNVKDMHLIMFTKGMLNESIGDIVKSARNLERLILLPLIGMQISSDDITRLAELQRLKNQLLKVSFESSTKKTHEEILKKYDGMLNTLQFGSINQLTYEFSYLYGWKRWSIAKCNVFI